jgi:hypothetical protein
MAGRPRKSLAHHEATGATAKNRKRFEDRGNEARPTLALGDPPASFLPTRLTGYHSSEAKELLQIWHEVVEQGEASNVDMTFADRLTVENLCRCQRALRRSPKPSSGLLAQAKAYASELGLTPTGRTRVAARKAKEADGRTPEGWAALAGERAQGAHAGAGTVQ